MHIKNHYATSGFITGLKNLVDNYHKKASSYKLIKALEACQLQCSTFECELNCEAEVATQEYPNSKLLINNMSLPWGGVFDFKNDWRKEKICTNKEGAARTAHI